METTRQNKIGRMLQKEMGEIMLLHARDIHGILITVSNVRVTADLGIAYVYLSIFPSEKAKEILVGIEEKSKFIRFELGKRIRHQLRIVPELQFFIDDSLDYLENIDRLLKK
jgi:ribosome-binding factor A